MASSSLLEGRGTMVLPDASSQLGEAMIENVAATVHSQSVHEVA